MDNKIKSYRVDILNPEKDLGLNLKLEVYCWEISYEIQDILWLESEYILY